MLFVFMGSPSAKILYQETNPYSSLTGFLEDDGRTVYLYIQSEFNHEWGIKSLWVRNLIDAPVARSPEDLKNGLAPLLTIDETLYPKAQPTFNSDEIHFIWTEEGDGLALFIREELYAFIPSYSGLEGFHGYSKEAKAESLTAHPLGNSYHGPIPEKIEQARKFWEFRADKNSWREIQKRRLSFLEEKLGEHVQYWSADGGKYPPLAIAKFTPLNFDHVVVYSTIGMSAQSMPQVELYHKDYPKYSRVELILAYKHFDSTDKPDTWIPHLLGEVIKYPWNMLKWFGHGHSIEIPRRDPNSLYLNFTALLFINPYELNFFEDMPDLKNLNAENGNRINFLFLLPVTEEEEYLIREKGIKNLAEKIPWFHDSERESFS